GAEIAFGGYFGTVQVWDVTTGKCKMEKHERDAIRECFVRHLPGSLHAVSSYGEKGARLWDEEGRHSRVILQHSDIVIQRFAFSSCGRWITSVQDDTIHLWRSRQEGGLQDWEYVLAAEGCLGVIKEIVWRPNKLEFATADVGGSTRVWRIVEKFNKVLVQLVWGTGGSALVSSGSRLDDAIGLNTFNRNLLKPLVVHDGDFFSSVDESSRKFPVEDDVEKFQSLQSDFGTGEGALAASESLLDVVFDFNTANWNLLEQPLVGEGDFFSSVDESSRRFQVEDDVEMLQCLQFPYARSISPFSLISSRGHSPLQVPTEPDSDYYFSDDEQ
ncbi:hypothetical protein BGZ89_004088, partial [Linnemannia elongata]